MKSLIKLEEVAVFALTVFFLYKLELHVSWWMYLLLFFSPDIGMIGYLINTKAGAITYNLLHHKALACTLIFLGMIQTSDYLILVGLLYLGHSSFDRILGYGLKYPDNFKHTSIGYM